MNSSTTEVVSAKKYFKACDHKKMCPKTRALAFYLETIGTTALHKGFVRVAKSCKKIDLRGFPIE